MCQWLTSLGSSIHSCGGGLTITVDSRGRLWGQSFDTSIIHTILGFERQVAIVDEYRLEVHQMKRFLSKFLHDESGATAIEYCLIAAGIALAIIAIINGLGVNLVDKLNQLLAALN